jgi:hypothetical protein
MAIFIRASAKALLLTGSLLVAGCAGEGNDVFTTGSLGSQQTVAAAPEPKVDPVCVTLVSRIDALRKEGIADKIEKAAIKKYKMTTADLSKADQLTKANAEFQLRCATVTPNLASASQMSAGSPSAQTSAAKTTAKAAAAKN